MGKIVFLNDCSSAGKTSLANVVQRLSEETFLFFGIDTLFGAMPRKVVGFGKEAEKGFQYVVDSKTGDLTGMKVSPYARLVFSCLPK